MTVTRDASWKSSVKSRLTSAPEQASTLTAWVMVAGEPGFCCRNCDDSASVTTTPAGVMVAQSMGSENVRPTAVSTGMPVLPFAGSAFARKRSSGSSVVNANAWPAPSLRLPPDSVARAERTVPASATVTSLVWSNAPRATSTVSPTQVTVTVGVVLALPRRAATSTSNVSTTVNASGVTDEQSRASEKRIRTSASRATCVEPSPGVVPSTKSGGGSTVRNERAAPPTSCPPPRASSRAPTRRWRPP